MSGRELIVAPVIVPLMDVVDGRIPLNVNVPPFVIVNVNVIGGKPEPHPESMLLASYVEFAKMSDTSSRVAAPLSI